MGQVYWPEPAGFTLPAVNTGAIASSASAIGMQGGGFSNVAALINTTWQNLGASYQAPETPDLLGKLTPLQAAAMKLQGDVGSVARTLHNYASTTQSLQTQMNNVRTYAQAAKTEAQMYLAQMRSGMRFAPGAVESYTWQKTQSIIAQGRMIYQRWEMAQWNCANSIMALAGGQRFAKPAGSGGPFKISRMGPDAPAPSSALRRTDLPRTDPGFHRPFPGRRAHDADSPVGRPGGDRQRRRLSDDVSDGPPPPGFANRPRGDHPDGQKPRDPESYGTVHPPRDRRRLTDQDRAEIIRGTQGTRDLNEDLGSGNPSAASLARAQRYRDALDKLDRFEGRVESGQRFNRNFTEQMLSNDWKPGSTVKIPTFVSSSYRKGAGGNVNLRIHSKNGRLIREHGTHNRHNSESEVVFPNDTEFTIKNRWYDKQNKEWTVELVEVVPPVTRGRTRPVADLEAADVKAYGSNAEQADHVLDLKAGPSHSRSTVDYGQQIERQTEAINRMTADDLVARADNPAVRTGAAQKAAREEYRRERMRHYKLRAQEQGIHGWRERESWARQRVDEEMDRLAALHEPDIAGFGLDVIGRENGGYGLPSMGDKSINSSLGSQWKKVRDDLLAYARRMVAEGRGGELLNISWMLRSRS